jgi:putative phosphoribosyl transferase
MLFMDRPDAGRKLAARLRPWRGQHPVVLALPRGGVPVGFEIARELQAPLDLVLVRKIGAPGQPELAVGAVADSEHPELVVDERIAARVGASPRYLEEAKAEALAEIDRRRSIYLRDRKPVEVRGRPVIVVDDGIATGASVLAALRATRRRGPERLLAAVPVAPPDAFRRLRDDADEVICLQTPRHFAAVGEFYSSFPQLQDNEVVALLERATEFASDTAASPQEQQA